MGGADALSRPRESLPKVIDLVARAFDSPETRPLDTTPPRGDELRPPGLRVAARFHELRQLGAASDGLSPALRYERKLEELRQALAQARGGVDVTV